jgi:hypothetical protein
MMPLQMATNNRLKCQCGDHRIKKGTKYLNVPTFRKFYRYINLRNIHICEGCLLVYSKIINRKVAREALKTIKDIPIKTSWKTEMEG